MMHTLGRTVGSLRPRAMSLVELLVVLFAVGLLASLLMPGLSAAREQARGIVCQSNLHQLMLASGYYAEDYGGRYCPGASGFLQNLHRWHGTRSRADVPFDPANGPLAPYLGAGGEVRHCPSFPAEEIAAESGGFERGNGGYGYNNAFIGVDVRPLLSGAYEVMSDRTGTALGRVASPATTILFSDAAFAASTLVEYSFTEPRFHPRYPAFRTDPSMHFRHRGYASVGWCDGHVDRRTRTFTHSSGLYAADPDRLGIGWPGPHDDNGLFDLK